MALNSLNPAAVVIKGIGEAPVDGQQYTRQDADWVAASGGGGIVGMSVFTTSGTWDKAVREAELGVTINRVILEVQGSGGGGGYTDGSYGGSGGGGGGYSKSLIDVSAISSSTITVGSGGSGGSGNGTYGGAGGASSWADGTNTLTANGGAGGASSGTSGLGTAGGGLGGTASGGDINVSGGSGTSSSYGVDGGDSVLGTRGVMRSSGSITAGAAGAGGAGKTGNAGAGVGGAGGGGIVIVTEIA